MLRKKFVHTILNPLFFRVIKLVCSAAKLYCLKTHWPNYPLKKLNKQRQLIDFSWLLFYKISKLTHSNSFSDYSLISSIVPLKSCKAYIFFPVRHTNKYSAISISSKKEKNLKEKDKLFSFFNDILLNFGKIFLAFFSSTSHSSALSSFSNFLTFYSSTSASTSISTSTSSTSTSTSSTSTSTSSTSTSTSSISTSTSSTSTSSTSTSSTSTSTSSTSTSSTSTSTSSISTSTSSTSTSSTSTSTSSTSTSTSTSTSSTSTSSTSTSTSTSSTSIYYSMLRSSENYSPDIWLLYCHGGGFCINQPLSFKIIFESLCANLTCRSIVISPSYRKSPENTYPCAINDIINTYEYILNCRNADPKRIVFLGDSSGANLAIASTLKSINVMKLPSPSCIAVFSPWLDLTLKAPSYSENAKEDFMFSREVLDRCATIYVKGIVDDGKQSVDEHNRKKEEQKRKLKEFCMLKGMPYYNMFDKYDIKEKLKNCLLSPVYLDNIQWIRSLPKTLIHVGSKEIMLSDSLVFGRRVNLTLKNFHKSIDKNKSAVNELMRNSKNMHIPQNIIEKEIDLYGRLDENTKKKMTKEASCFASDCELSDSENKVFVKVWKNEFHDFPILGSLTSPNAAECLQETASFIYERVFEN